MKKTDLTPLVAFVLYVLIYVGVVIVGWPLVVHLSQANLPNYFSYSFHTVLIPLLASTAVFSTIRRQSAGGAIVVALAPFVILFAGDLFGDSSFRMSDLGVTAVVATVQAGCVLVGWRLSILFTKQPTKVVNPSA
jgi:hypothetical protein